MRNTKVTKAEPKKKSTRRRVKKNQSLELQETLAKVRSELFSTYRNTANPILSRTALSTYLGSQFDGERDLYATFGYPRVLTYNHYRAMYERMGMATRVVEKFSDNTWGKTPIIIDGDARSDGVGEKTTDFLDDWNALCKDLKIWQVMRQADIMCGIGRYSVIFLGSPGSYNSPVKKGGGLFFLSAFDESQAKIKSYIKDRKSKSYGMPEMYEIEFSALEEYESTRQQLTHHTRCIHISENRLGSRVFGRPRMQEVFNRLMDLEKVTGGGAEAAWLAVYMGFLLLTREGTELPEEGSEEWNTIEQTLEKFAHRIQRFATLKGVENVHSLGVHEVRIKDIWTVLIADLAGSKNIPQRILLGSERGELASSQDMQEWNGVILNRQKNFAEPEILEPVINFCIANEVIRPPKSKKWQTVWQPVYTPTQIEKADYALRIAQGANQVTNGAPDLALDVNEWRGLLDLPPKDMEELIATLEDIIRGKGEEPVDDKESPNGKANGGVKVPARNYPKRSGLPNITPQPENQP